MSPYTRSAANVDAQVMVLLQDWSSDESLRGPYLPARTELGEDPSRTTNKRLKSLLRGHLEIELVDMYSTNVFPFVKPGAMSARIPRADWYAPRGSTRAADSHCPAGTGRLPWHSAYLVVRAAAGQPAVHGLDDAIRNPFDLGLIRVWCQAHTGQMGTNNRNRGGVNRVDDDWAEMARDLAGG